MVRVALVIVLMAFASSAMAEEPFTVVSNLPEQCSKAIAEQKVCLIYVSRIGCPYCTKLEADVLMPLTKVEKLTAQVQLYELPWELQSLVTFQHQNDSAGEFIRRYGIVGTPTLLLLDQQGRELSSRQVGYQSEDFYWHYLEQAIVDARAKLLDRKQHLSE